LGIANNDKRLKSGVDQSGAAMAIGRLTAAVEISGKDDMEPQNFRERQGPRSDSGSLGRNVFAFCSLLIIQLPERDCQEIKKIIAAQDS
jgi:hypothetical protein